ncbi:MAG: hypothetical protein ACRCW3_03360, partial [Metamycoplasmataceae bacterium]
EILDQLSIILPPNIEAHKITFTNIDTSNPARITFTVNYNGVASSNSLFLNTKKPTSNVVVIVSIIIPISALLIAAIVGGYFWMKKKNDSGNGSPKKPVSSKTTKKPEVKKPEVKQPEIKKPEIKKPEVKKPEINKVEIPKVTPKKMDVKQPERKNTYEEYFTQQMLDLTNKALNVAPKKEFDKQNNQSYGHQINADWYKEQANAPATNDKNNQQWYNEQANIQYPYTPPVAPNSMMPNQMNTMEQEQWLDNRWYSNQADTGHWENGNWFENKEQPNLKRKANFNENIVHTRDNYQFNNTSTDKQSNSQNKPKNTTKDKTDTVISDWTSIIDMIEK